MQERLNQDLKAAMLAGDKTKAETLKVLKNVLQNAAIEKGAQDSGLSDDDVIQLLAKEAKKRSEAAQIYQKAGETARMEAELAELKIINSYLPKQMPENQLRELISQKIKELNASSLADMGKVIGAVKSQTGGAAEGSQIARLTKEMLEQ